MHFRTIGNSVISILGNLCSNILTFKKTLGEERKKVGIRILRSIESRRIKKRIDPEKHQKWTLEFRAKSHTRIYLIFWGMVK